MREIDNIVFEEYYKKNIYSQYPDKVTPSFFNVKNHDFSIWKRLNLSNINVYTIDPEGCDDADDGFSYYEENNKKYIAIHIADPTEYISLDSDLWEKIIQQSLTYYPSNNETLHLLPENIMEMSSLMENKYGNIKNAVSIITEVDNKFNPVNEIKYYFTKIKVTKENCFSYNKAAKHYENNIELYNVFLFTENLKKIRSLKTKSVVLNELSNSYPIKNDDEWIIYKDTKNEVLMKQMISELAIFVNSFIGEYLKYNFSGKGIFRTCNASGLLNTLENDISGIDLMNKIILNGISADYLSNVLSHDLIGMPEYSHFTSPMRRASDCICHYLLKYIYLRQYDKSIKLSFDNTFLDNASYTSSYKLKKSKKIQHKDLKFRLIQCLYIMVMSKKITLEYIILSYTGLFINVMIQKIDHHDVQLSYTLRLKKGNLNIEILNQKQTLDISIVNCFQPYDQNTFPELDEIIFSFFTN